MRSSLAESFALLRPAIPPALISGPVADRLQAVAARLVPTEYAGFECRLDADDERVDLQQGISRPNGTRSPLSDCLSALSPSFEGTCQQARWDELRHFADEWTNPSSPLHMAASQIWLEFDVPGMVTSPPIPCVFVVLAPAAASVSAARQAKETVLSFLLGADRLQSAQALDRCRAACPDEGARISHIGAMFGRTPQSVRVHISRLHPRAFSEYLSRIGWPGDASAIQGLVRALTDVVDHVTLCLDVAEDVQPQLGLECFFDHRGSLDPRWTLMLDHLVSRGLCSESKRDGLLGWPGVTRPEPHLPWPEVLLIESLRQPPDRFGAFSRRLSHVKISCAPGRRPYAKAYFGYAHEWLQPVRSA